MKSCLKVFMLLAMVWAIPIANAQTYSLTVNTTPEWINKTTKTPYSSRDCAIGGLSGDEYKIYSVDYKQAAGAINYYAIGKSGFNTYSLLLNSTRGYTIAHDDAFNIITTSVVSGWSAISKVEVWNGAVGNNPTLTSIDLSNYKPVISRMMSASGDVLNGTGYLWFVKDAGSVLNRVTIVDKKATKLDTWNFVDESGNAITAGSPAYFHVYKDGNTERYFLHSRGTGFYDVTLSGTTAKCVKISSSKLDECLNQYSGIGATIEMFKGHKLLFCHNYSTHYSGTFSVVDLTDNVILSTITDLGGTPSASGESSSSFGVWVHAVENPSNPKKLDLYAYKSGVGAAKYSITAKQTSGFTDPVVGVTATTKPNGDKQDVTLSWSTPVTDGIVKDYTVSVSTDGGATWTNNTVTTTSYIYTGLESGATVKFKIVPNYTTGDKGTAVEKEVTSFKYMPPRDVRTTNYAGYCRVAVNYRAPENKGGYDVLYNIYRDDVLVGSEMAQFEFIDAGVAEGTHNYVVEAVYVVTGTSNIVASVKSSPVSVTVDPRNEQKVNYRLETVYNYRVDELWNADASWETVAPGFNPINDIRANSENYRQGALIEIDGKKYWYISVRSNTITNALSDGTAGGILKVSAEDDVIAAGGAPTMLTLPKAIANGQTSGIATDEGGNIFIRGMLTKEDLNTTSDWVASKNENFAQTLGRGVIYSADLTKSYEFMMPSRTMEGFAYPGRALASEMDYTSVAATNAVIGRTDYYCMSGDLFKDKVAYLYCSATGSRQMSVVKLSFDGTNVTATLDYQYTLTEYENPYSAAADGNGNVAIELVKDASDKVVGDKSAEHYVFPMFDKDETTLLGYIYERRSTGYFFIPKGATTQDQKVSIYTDGTDAGKVANSGGTLVRYQTKLDNGQIATQLFIITPQSFFSKNIGSFTVGAVYNNKFEKPAAANEEMIVPVANMVQSDFDNLNIVGNANGSWLFAEFNDNGTEIAEDDHIDIYQYVPGVRIAKYKLYGSISFLSSTPVLTIETIKSTDEDGRVKEISHFKATTTWETPATYQGSGDYLIKEYLVELLDPSGNVIDTRTVDASTSTATPIPNDPNGRMSYSLTFEKTDDLEGCTATPPTGNSSNHFIDDNATYTSRVTVVYDLRQHIENTTGTVPSDVKLSDVNSAQDTHEYTPNEPKGEVTVYTGKEGTNVDGAYRVEINIMRNETESAPVSHYELSYWADKDEDGVKEQYKIEDFILVTSDSQTENQNIVPGTTVRYEQPGKVLSESGESFVCFYVDNREYVYDPVTDAGKWVLTEEEKDWQIPSNWEYQLTAVYANTNSLLRSAETATIKTTDIKNETTGEELLESSEEATLKAFPIPAGSTLTVQSPRGIEQITMLSASGMVVKDIVGDGNTVMTINVDDLAAGYYMLRVNNQLIIKVVKK